MVDDYASALQKQQLPLDDTAAILFESLVNVTSTTNDDCRSSGLCNRPQISQRTVMKSMMEKLAKQSGQRLMLDVDDGTSYY